MTLEELQQLSIMDVLKSDAFCDCIDRKLKSVKQQLRKKGAHQRTMADRLIECGIADAETFIPVYANIIMRCSNLPSSMRDYVKELGDDAMRHHLLFLRSQCTDVDKHTPKVK